MKLCIFNNPRTLPFSKANTIVLHFVIMRKFTLYLQLRFCSCHCDLYAVSREETSQRNAQEIVQLNFSFERPFGEEHWAL